MGIVNHTNQLEHAVRQVIESETKKWFDDNAPSIEEALRKRFHSELVNRLMRSVDATTEIYKDQKELNIKQVTIIKDTF